MQNKPVWLQESQLGVGLLLHLQVPAHEVPPGWSLQPHLPLVLVPMGETPWLDQLLLQHPAAPAALWLAQMRVEPPAESLLVLVRYRLEGRNLWLVLYLALLLGAGNYYVLQPDPGGVGLFHVPAMGRRSYH